MKKLDECKNFGELYETIGTENFATIAYVLTILLIFAPIVVGVVNYMMLQDSYNYISPYDAYEYNYKCITVWNAVFSLMIIWTGINVLGRIRINNKGIKGFINDIKQKQGWLLWWFILLGWSIIPVIFSDDVRGSIIGTSQLASGYISHIYMFAVLGCAFLASDKKHIDDIVWAFVGIMDVLAVVMIAFEYDLPFFRFFSAAPGVSVYTNSNHYGYMITITYMAVSGTLFRCLYDEKIKQATLKKVFCIVSLIVNALAMVINDTLGSYLAIVFTLLVMPVIWCIRMRRFKVGLIIPFAIIIGFTFLGYYGFIATKLGSTIGQSLVVFISDLFKVSQKSDGYQEAGTGRIALWIDTIKKIIARPIVGYGPDVIVDKNNHYILWNTPHNEFLECAFFLGIPGLVFYLTGLIALCINKCKRIKMLSYSELIAAGVVIGYLASSFFGVRKFNTVCYFFMFLGILMREEKEEKTNKSVLKSGKNK